MTDHKHDWTDAGAGDGTLGCTICAAEQRSPERIVAGDTFIDPDGSPVWTALHDAQVIGREVHIDVRFTVDKGCSTRVWEAGTDHKLLVMPYEPF